MSEIVCVLSSYFFFLKKKLRVILVNTHTRHINLRNHRSFDINKIYFYNISNILYYLLGILY